ncbi:MAG: putative hydrolase YxeP [Firmicutes bacterium]|nr:putative hydrolase YxeP [Bacillota bacterium]
MRDFLFETLLNLRRQLHGCPEGGFTLSATRACLQTALKAAGLAVEELGGGLVAELGAAGGRRVLLRAELDGLAVADGKDVPYRSRHEGFAHACGHDGHTAMLFGAILLLKNRRLPGRVRFIFQPAEETPPGGAQAMLAAGVLKDVAAAFALHLVPQLPFGSVGIKAGVLMAAADNFRLVICGSGGHGAMPHQAVDALVVAAQTVLALQALVSRQIDPLEPVVVTVGKITGGSVANVVAQEVVLEGTVRTLAPELRQTMPQRLRTIAEGICQAFGARCQLEYSFGYPVLKNDQAMTELAAKAVVDSGLQQVILDRPLLGGEDFAYLLEQVPGCMLFLGSGDERFSYPLHHPCFDFNEAILPLGAKLLACLAEKALLV